MSFSFRELLDTTNTWKDRHSKRWKFNLSLKSKVSCQCPLECPRGFQVHDRSLSQLVTQFIMRSVVLSFEMFTGSVIDIFFSQKESLLAVTHFTIEGKVCC